MMYVYCSDRSVAPALRKFLKAEQEVVRHFRFATQKDYLFTWDNKYLYIDRNGFPSI